jgi:hypothetical protein
VDFDGFQWTSEGRFELEMDDCDFTRYFAASELIILPQEPSFEHDVGNEK